MSRTNEFKPNRYALNGLIALFALATAVITYFYVPDYVRLLLSGDVNELVDFVFLLAILSICRSLPLPTDRKDEEFNISTIIIFTSVLYKGISATVLIVLLSSFFTFSRWDGKKLSHVFNTQPSKSIFNCASLIIPLYLGWLCFQAFNPTQGTPVLPDILLPSFLYLLIFLLFNSALMALLFRILSGVPFLQNLRYGFFSMLPTLMMLAPLGFLMAYFFFVSPYIALIFFIPLLFARYAFKLYLDSRTQFMKTISTLTTAIEAKDEYTEGHSRRVGQYAVEIATRMNIKGVRIENIKVAAVLHDIGKIGIDDEILRKPGKLNDDEWARIMQHPSIGIHILEEVDMPQVVKDIIEYHHLRYDGKGYPTKRTERPIPLEVHIITLADAYDAMTSDRPYRSAMPEQDALENIVQGRGTQFHPDVVDVFLEMKEYEPRH